MQRRHGPALDAAGESVAAHEIISGFELFDEAFERLEIIAVIGVAHDHVLAPGRLDASLQGIAVAAFGGGHDPRAERLRDLLRSVDTAIVDDDDLAGKVLPREIALCFHDTGAKRPRLVET